MEENIRSKFNQNIDETQKQFLNRPVDDTFAFEYTGRVVDNSDPDHLGRIKIRVFGIFNDNVPDSDLPLAIPENSLVDGSFIVPDIDDIVAVRFDKGDIYFPKYYARALQKDLPSIRLKDYPDTIVLYALESGGYLIVNRKTSEMIFHHKVGSEIRMNSDGTVEINARIIKMNPSKTTFVPMGSGNMCSIPYCPMTGIKHQGSMSISI